MAQDEPDPISYKFDLTARVSKDRPVTDIVEAAEQSVRDEFGINSGVAVEDTQITPQNDRDDWRARISVSVASLQTTEDDGRLAARVADAITDVLEGSNSVSDAYCVDKIHLR